MIELGKANVVREGKDVTLITYGPWLKTAKEAVEKMSDIDVEIIDLRTLSPLDTETIINSVKKTGKCVIVNEAPRTLGFASEIMARINEKAFYSLEAPVERVTGYDTIIPLRLYENYYLPNHQRIIDAVEKVMETAKGGA